MKYRTVSLLIALMLVACDVVTDNYPTLQDANKDRLFERGWLPDILPDSTKRIRTSNNLDLNISEGEFYFDPGDYRNLTVKLERYSSPKSPFVDLEKNILMMETKG